MDTAGRGILDAPQIRAMRISREAIVLLFAVLVPITPACGESCNKPALRTRIAETLKLASEQRPGKVTFRTHAEGVKLSQSLKSE